MKVLLIGVNASYMHTCLAVRSIKNYVEKFAKDENKDFEVNFIRNSNNLSLTIVHLDVIIIHARFAVVAELAYAHDSGSCPRRWVRVQVSSTAATKNELLSTDRGSFFY